MFDLAELIGLFYPQPAELGTLRELPRSAVPLPFEELLVHEHHMTVTVERFHGCQVDVQVLDKVRTPQSYSRKILLLRQRDRHVVQFGLVRLHLQYLAPAVQTEILAEQKPLGRILIEHDVLREIQLLKLWEVTPGPDLCRCFQLSQAKTCYGRTALISCDGQPAIELLEIVTPENEPANS